MRTLAVLGLLTMSLTGCATAGSNACPREVEYSAEFQGRLLGDVIALPAGSSLGVAMADYGRLRDQARACRAR